MLDLWMCTRLLGNKASWYRAWLTERGGSVDSHPRSKTQYSLHVKKDNKTLDTRYTSCFQCSQNNPTGSTKWIHQLFDGKKASWEKKGEWPLGPVSSDMWIWFHFYDGKLNDFLWNCLFFFTVFSVILLTKSLTENESEIILIINRACRSKMTNWFELQWLKILLLLLLLLINQIVQIHLSVIISF